MYTNRKNEENADIVEVLLEHVDTSVMNEINSYVEDSRGRGKSLILDLSKLQRMTSNDVAFLLQLNTNFYQEHNLSFVIIATRHLFEEDIQDQLNICPTEIEAIEIVNMEVIEREFLQDEE